MDLTPIGAYQRVALLGSGGMGAVYRARHQATGQEVALKTVVVDGAPQLAAIRREIQALTHIRHPGIVRIVDHGIQDGRPWYAMELLEGETLRSYCLRVWSRSESRPFEYAVTAEATPAYAQAGLKAAASAVAEARLERAVAAGGHLEEVLSIAEKLCRALAFLHGEGLVNGDLKPENVLLAGDHPVIIDFGLSHGQPDGSSREALESWSTSRGTIQYVAPEQLRGDLVDARSDLYAFGCVFYELLTGRVPFVGSSELVALQHLTSEPLRPSAIVKDLPPALDELALRLLSKDPAKRAGYADEVANELRVTRPSSMRLRSEASAPAVSYLYRPRLVGRDRELRTLCDAITERARGDTRAIVLSGDSGVGKTRLVLEALREVGHGSVQPILGAMSRGGASARAPLHALIPLLQAIADRCVEGGPEETEQLLGTRRSVLAEYLPSLSQLPARLPPDPVVDLPAPQARQRLFDYLRESIRALVSDRNVLWVVDDLGDADELSLEFLAELLAPSTQCPGLLLVATARTEHVGTALAQLIEAPGTLHIRLEPLDDASIESIVRDMLALRDPANDFVSFLASETGGNPFFVSEYVRAAVQARLLYREAGLGWNLVRSEADDAAQYRSLPLPPVLQDVLLRRIGALSNAARHVALAASVFGPAAALPRVQRVTELAEAVFDDAIHELGVLHVLEYLGDGRLRFTHDKLREAIYRAVDDITRRAVHGRVARTLEADVANAEDAARYWVVLADHFGAAGEVEPAILYSLRAAEYARATAAPRESLRLYEQAVELASGASDELSPVVEVAAREGLADALALAGKREEARAQYERARALTSIAGVERARLIRKQGKTWETQNRHAEAANLYNQASAELGVEQTDWSDLVRQEWIEIRSDQLWVSYWLHDVDRMKSLLSELRPAIARMGTAAQRVRFYQGQMMMNLRRDRFEVQAETLMWAERACEVCRSEGVSSQLPMIEFGYGFVLFLSHRLAEAQTALSGALELAVRAGDTLTQARCLSYLAAAHRVAGATAETIAVNERNEQLCRDTATGEYLACSIANRAWLAMRDDRLDDAIVLADEATAIWENLPLKFPFQWLARVPRMEAHLRKDALHEALEDARALARPTQQRLPADAATLVEGLAAALPGEEQVRADLGRLVESLRRSGYG